MNQNKTQMSEKEQLIQTIGYLDEEQITFLNKVIEASLVVL